MPIFITVAVIGLVYLVGSLMFGHEHDHDVDHDHDAGHEGHEHADHSKASLSVFSPKVIATLLMAFGVTGAFARYYETPWPAASGYGLPSGLIFAVVIWGLLSVLYRQQANSLVETRGAIGQIGSVTVSIDPDAIGQVGVTVQGMYRLYDARSANNKAIPRGRSVTVTAVNGSELLVIEQVSSS